MLGTVHPEDRAVLGSDPSAEVNSNTAGRPPAGSIRKRKIPGFGARVREMDPSQATTETRRNSAQRILANRLFTLKERS